MKFNLVHNLERTLRSNPSGVVLLPEGNDDRVLAAAMLCIQNKIARCVKLFGDYDKISELTQSDSKELFETYLAQGSLEIINPCDAKLVEQTKLTLQKNFKTRGKAADEEYLQAKSKNSLYQAACALSRGSGNVCVSGAVHTTADVIRAGLAGVGLKGGIKSISSCFLLTRPSDNKTMMFADCGVIIDPDTNQLVDITMSTVETFKTILPELKPVVAFLSFSSKGSAKHPRQEKVLHAFQKFQTQFPEVESEGELQFDAAFDSKVGKHKAPGSSVPGRANIFIFPDLNSGNIGYKIAQKLGGFDAYGPLLQGFREVYSDLSRGATVNDIYTSCLISLFRWHTLNPKLQS